jgi:hypothetical protein
VAGARTANQNPKKQMNRIEIQTQSAGCVGIAGGEERTHQRETLSAALTQPRRAAKNDDWNTGSDFEVDAHAEAAAPAPTASEPTPSAETTAAQAKTLAATINGTDLIAQLRPTVQVELGELKTLCGRVTELRAKYNRAGHAPGSAHHVKEELKRNINRDATPEELDEVAARLAALDNVSHELTAAATHVVWKELEKAKAQGLAILDKCEAGLNQACAEAQVAEEQFFAAHSLPYEQTSLSRRAKAGLDRVRQMRESFDPHPRLPSEQGVWTFCVWSVLKPITD